MTKQSVPDRFWTKVDKSGECWTWTAHRTDKGYGVLGGARDGKNAPAHRVSWELANGLIPDGLWVLHSCDNPPCVNPAHLFLGSAADNTADMMAKGRNRARPRTKLTWADVRAIRDSVLPLRQLVASFGVTKEQIYRIRSGAQWIDPGFTPVTRERRTECRFGHPLDGVSKDTGFRFCRTCKASRDADWHARNGRAANARKRDRRAVANAARATIGGQS